MKAIAHDGTRINRIVKRSVNIIVIGLVFLAFFLALPYNSGREAGNRKDEGSQEFIAWTPTGADENNSSTDPSTDAEEYSFIPGVPSSSPGRRDVVMPFTQQVYFVSQYPELPTGCESVALTIVLLSMGFDLEKTTIADYYLDYSWDDFVNAYVGDPYSYEGMGAYPPAIAKAANDYLKSQSSKMVAYDITGTSWDGLFYYIDRGYPVIIWTTSYAYEPWYSDYEYDGWYWYENEHCVVLYGIDRIDSSVWVSDPTSGDVAYDTGHYRWVYEACGSMAVVIY